MTNHAIANSNIPITRVAETLNLQRDPNIKSVDGDAPETIRVQETDQDSAGRN